MEVRCCLTFLPKIIGLKIKYLFEKLKDKKTFDIDKRGMFLKVDLDYPEETQNLHKYFQLAPK